MSKTTSFPELDKLAEEKKEFEKRGGEVIKSVFKSVLAKHPKIQAMQWAQYTPYFNDGEECVFNVHDLHVKLEGEKEFLGSYDINDDNLHQAITALEKQLHKNKEILRSVFGDHAEITVSAEKITIEEHEHD